MVVKHFRATWFQEGRACGCLGDFRCCGSPWVFEEDCRGQWGYLLFHISLARWKCTHVFPEDEFSSASSTERMNVLCFLSWKNQLDRRIVILVLSHFSSWNSKSIIHNLLLEIHQKVLHFLLSLIYFAVRTETVRVLDVHCVLSPHPPPKPERRNIPSGICNKCCLLAQSEQIQVSLHGQHLWGSAAVEKWGAKKA